MKKIDLEKNYLDLEYQRNLNFLNTILIIGGGSLVAYLAALILDLNKWAPYTIIILIIVSSTSTLYYKINKNLISILNKIKNLKINEQ